MSLTAGTRLGPYEIVSPIGAGGMGEVYKARDTRLDRDVAVKVLPASFAMDAERLNRFEIEAKTTGQLNHPNVVSVFDIGTREGAPYLVTELLDGETLRERLSQSPLPLRKVLEFATQIARGLAAAHDRGIVHRDLKPENIFVTRDGRVKILDFGLARVVAPANQSDATAATALQATNPGTVLGTVGYMSPEQVRGKPADARSDLFAFGAILHEMVSGGRAFQRDSAADTMAAILKEDPPELTGSGMTIPPAVDRLIRRCLEKDPEERFQSARDLGFALEALGGGSSASSSSGAVMPVADSVASARRRPSHVVLLAIGAGLLVAGLGLGRFVLAPSPSLPIAAGITLRQLTYDRGVPMIQPVLSPDGASLAYVSPVNGGLDIWLQRVGGENPVDLTKDAPEHDFEPAFSPDGKFIAFRSERSGGGLFVMGATGESVRRLTDDGFNPAWSPDGKRIVYDTENLQDPTGRQSVSKLFVVDVSTGAKTKIYDGDAVQPQWSPDGKWIVYWGLPPGTGRRVIYTMPDGGGTPNVIVDDGAVNWSPQWSADGAFVYYASDRSRPMSIWRVPVDRNTAKASGSPERVTVATEAHFGISPEANGAFAFTSVSNVTTVDSYAFDTATARLGTAKTIVRTSRDIWQVAPSPDGKYLAMKVNDVSEDLELARPDGTTVTRLTNDDFRDRSPNWNQKADRVLFFSNRTGKYDLWSIRIDGSGLEQLTQGLDVAEPTISPDGRLVTVQGTGRDDTSIIDLTPPLERRRLAPMPIDGGRFVSSGWSSDSAHLIGTVFPPAPGAHPGVAWYTVASHSGVRLLDGTGAWVLPGDRSVIGIDLSGHFMIVDVGTHAAHVGDRIPPADSSSMTADGRTLYSTRHDKTSNIWMLALPASDRAGKK